MTSTIPIPRAGTTLSARTVTWLAEHPDTREVVSSVWTTLTELKQAGHHPGTLDALRFVLSQASFIYHEVTCENGRSDGL